jgi:hypothetical protein
MVGAFACRARRGGISGSGTDLYSGECSKLAYRQASGRIADLSTEYAETAEIHVGFVAAERFHYEALSVHIAVAGRLGLHRGGARVHMLGV